MKMLIIEETPPRTGQFAIYEWPSSRCLVQHLRRDRVADYIQRWLPNYSIKSDVNRALSTN
jgi:hypothetical protein